MSAPRRTFQVGLVGFGYAGATFHAPLIAATTGLRLAAVSSRDHDKVRASVADVVVFDDPLSLIAAEGLDLIVIASPNASHAPLARAAMEAGKAVVVDKPFTLDLVQARELVGVAETTGRLLSVFHNRRWDSDFQAVRQAIQAGEVGRVTHFESHFDRFRPEVRDRWRERAGPGNGVWFDLGPHLVDQALLLFGLPDRIQANLARQREGAETDDWAHVVLDYGNARVVLHASMVVAGGTPRFIVHGDKGSLVKFGSDRQEAQLLAGLRPGDTGWGEDPDPLVVHGPDGTVRQIATPAGDQTSYYRAIVAALAGEGSSPVEPIEALAVMAVVDAVVTSSRTGAAVDIPMTSQERGRFLELRRD